MMVLRKSLKKMVKQLQPGDINPAGRAVFLSMPDAREL
jgi:hypothetical protein